MFALHVTSFWVVSKGNIKKKTFLYSANKESPPKNAFGGAQDKMKATFGGKGVNVKKEQCTSGGSKPRLGS